MGLPVRDLILSKEMELPDFAGKVLAVDSFNLLYQFLTTIRQRDGSPLTDDAGNVTSHLTGLFSRTANLLQKGIKLIFVFDGEAPQLKSKERERRKEIKQEAQREYDIAKERGDITGMKKYAGRTSRLMPEMVDEAKALISAFGCPIVQAPSEGEAQAAHITRKGDAYATVSQDFDTLLHGAPRLVRNLSVAGKRKKTGKLGMITVKPEMITLSENLNSLGIDKEQLIALSMLVGTDYNIGGIKGIGPKKALGLVKEHGKEFEELFKAVKWDETFDIAWNEVYYLIKKMPVTDDYTLEWKDVDKKAITELLVDKHDFSPERVESTLAKFKTEQKGLGEFFS